MYANARGKKDYGPNLARQPGRDHKEVPESRFKKQGQSVRDRKAKAARDRKAEAARIEREAAIERTR
jgi:hypothetical protein